MKSIRAILSEIRPECNYETSNDFLVDGLLDSFDVVTLVSELESQYRIVIRGTDVLPENFRSLDAIDALLARYDVRR